MKNAIIALAAFLFVHTGLTAQDTETELVRSAFKHEKKEQVAAFMRLRDSEAAKFWPIYNEYETSRSAIGDRRIKLLQQYATAYEKRDTAVVEKLWKESASIQKAEIALREKYADIVRKRISSAVALNFYMVEDYISTAIKVQLFNSIPPPEM
jgi:hypothetical protein